MSDDVERYAEIAAALAGADDRASVLAKYGLTEETWEALDDEWQERLSTALEAHVEDGAPDLVTRFSELYARARDRASVEVMPFDAYLGLTSAIQRSTDVPRTLQTHGVTFAAYMRANQHWAVRIAKDPALAERLRRALEG